MSMIVDKNMEHAHDLSADAICVSPEQDLIHKEIPEHQQPQNVSTEEETEMKISSVPDIQSEIYTEANHKTKNNSIHHTQYEGEIVITGISGRFPESANLKEFEDNLFNGVNMISDDERRWTRGFYGAITKSGKLKDLTRFDAQFFNIHAKQANAMDPQLRMLHELTYEAMVDAGVNPASMRGSRTGVYVGLMSSESEVAWSQDPDKCTGYEILGCVRSMLANRISFSFDLKGPSMCLDTACSSSLIGLELAVRAMRAGHIDSAIIGGANLCLDPIKSLQYMRLGMLSPDGSCKSFDISANGYARSEAAAVMFIQKRDIALRSYATIVNVRANTDGFKTQGATFPSGETQKKLLEEIYAESRIDPSQISYVEAHGTGTLAGDPQELNAITDVFCQNRDPNNPLLIGSVKSNMGHSEPTSGICGIAKIIFMIQTGRIPANLHFKTPNPEIYGLVDGKLKVITENLPWDGGLVGLNSFGFGGSNVHVILKCDRKSSASFKSESSKIPLIVPVSGRTRNACEFALKELTSNHQKYQEAISLLHKVSLRNTPGHPFRGFAFRKDDGTLDLEIQKQEQQSKAQFGPGVGNVENGNARPVWYVFSGVGSQFVGMGRDLMRFKIFKNSMETSAQILQSQNTGTGVDLLDILENSDEESLGQSVLRSAICITSIQVGMIDLLKSVGLSPDGIVGHSVGEVACAYADGCLSHEQTILTACRRAQLIDEGSKDREFEGAMAAVGLTWEDAISRCPEGIYPACHNSHDSVTISGPKKLLTPFVEQLTSEGVFAKEVNSSGQAYHSPYISHLGPKLKEILDQVITEPKARSPKWKSSSLDLGPSQNQNQKQVWDFDSQFASADYFVNNLVSPVRFHEVLVEIPENSVVIEIAPHCLLQAILKRSTPSTCAHIGLNHRNSKDNAAHFSNALGRLYNQGLQLNFTPLYDAVKFPISPTAPSLSPLIQWDHSAVWKVPDYTKENATAPFLRNSGGERNNVFEISLANTSHEFYKGHCIDGMTIFPGTGYLCLVWEYFARLKKSTQSHLPVVFENVRFQRATILPKNGEGSVKFHLNILEGSGEFEIQEGSSIAVSGIIKEATNCSESEKGDNLTDPTKLKPPSADIETGYDSNSGYVKLNSKDAYKELRLRGYLYDGIFQGIQTVTLKTPGSNEDQSHDQDQNQEKGQDQGLWATLSWNENWVSFLDTLLHFTLLNKSHEALYLPTRFEKVYINPQNFLQKVQETPSAPSIPAFYDQGLDMVSCPGVTIRGIHTSWAPRHVHQSAPQLEDYKFKPYFDFDHYKSSNEEKCKLDDTSDLDKEEVTGNTNSNSSAALPFRNRMDRRKMSLAATHGHIKENTALRFCVDVTIENTQALYGYEKLRVVEITGGELSSNCLSIPVSEIIDHQPHFTCEFTVFTADEDPPEALNKLPASSQMTVKRLKRGENFEYVMENETGYHLVIAHNRSLIPELVERMSHRSFLLYYADRNQERKRRQSGLLPFHPMELNERLILIAHKSSEGSRLNGGDYYLYRKFDKVMDGDAIGKFIPAQRIIEIDHNDQNFGWVEQLKVAMKESMKTDEEKEGEKKEQEGEKSVPRPWKILLYSQTESTSGILGVVNCLKTEPGGHNIRCFLIKKKRGSDLHFDFKEPNSELQEMLTRDLLMNVYDEEVEEWGSYRHFQLPSLIKFPYRKVEQAYIAPLARGDLSSLHWIQSGSTCSNKKDNVVNVYYTALNTRDVYWATGEISPDALPQNLVMRDDVLGMEISGKMLINDLPKRVMAIIPGKGLAITAQIDPLLTWEVPEYWSLAQSCSVPLAYSLAYYALVIRGQVRQGESILIHYGSGNGSEVTGLCQAAISIALGMESQLKITPESKMKSKVFVCVKSERERVFLKTVFPQLEDRNFTTLTSFESHILKETGGRGIDLVLNTMLSGEGFHASIRILTKLGRFLDARSSFEKSAVLEMQAKNLSFHHIELSDLFSNDCEIKLRVKKLLTEGIEQGVVVPIQTTIFSDDIAEVEKAFRKLAQKNGEFEKILIQLRKEDEDENPNPNPDQVQDQDKVKEKSVQAIARSYFDPQKFYVLIGGLGGFGLELGSWMIERGARKIILVSRTGITNGYQNHTVTKWRNLGATVIISKADLTQMDNARSFVKTFIPDVENPEYLGPLGGFINLAMVLRDALFENQTPENFEIVSKPKANVTLNLDQLTRELRMELEYFVTFSSISCGRGTPGQTNYGFANSIMEHVCVQRTKDGVPGKSIAIEWGAIGDVGAVMDEFKNVDDDFVLVGTRPQKILSCLNSLDLLLQQEEPIVGSMVVADKHLSKSSSKSSGKTSGKKGRKNQLSLVRRVMNIMGMDDITNAIVHHSQVTLAEMGMDSLMGVEIKQMIENHQSVVYTIANVRKLTLGKLKEMDESAGVKEDEDNEEDEEEEMHEAENSVETKENISNIEAEKQQTSPTSDPLKDEEKKDTTNYFTNQRLLHIVLYPLGIFGFYFIFLLYLMSQFLRFLAKPILHYFYGDELRLMDRPTDGIFVINKQTSNIVMVLKCEGDTPDGNSLMKSFEQKVLEFKPNVTLADGRVIKYEHSLYDALRWKISHNHLFYCWRKQKDFDVKDHFTFDLEDNTPGSTSDLDSATKKAAEFYLEMEWTGEKPQWEVRLISRKTATPQQFSLCVVVHHSYSDGMAVAQMLQYALADRQPPLSISQLESENLSTKSYLNLQSSKFQGCSKLEKLGIIFRETFKTWILPSHLIATKGIQCYLDALECPSSKKLERKENEAENEKDDNNDKNVGTKSKRQCAWESFDYKTLKSLKYPQEIAPKGKSISISKTKSTSVPLTVVVLACMSRVYTRIYSEARKKIPTKLIAWIPYGEYSDSTYNVGLRNNFSPAWPSLPCGIEDSKQLIHQVQLALDGDTGPEFLHASWSIMTFFSLLIKPLMPLAYLAPKFTFVYSSVPIHTPSDFTVLNNIRVKSVFGYPPLGMDGHASLSAGIQEDSVNFSLVVDETIVGDIPNFTTNFFPYFKQELDKLIREFN